MILFHGAANRAGATTATRYTPISILPSPRFWSPSLEICTTLPVAEKPSVTDSGTIGPVTTVLPAASSNL